MQLFGADVFGVLCFIYQLIYDAFTALDTCYIATETKISLALNDFDIEALLDIFHVIVVFTEHGF